jgi:hypothetical protein
MCQDLLAPARTLNNKGMMNKRGEEVISTLELANYDHMNLMEVLEYLWDKGNYVLENTWAHLNPAGFKMGVSANVWARREGEWYFQFP